MIVTVCQELDLFRQERKKAHLFLCEMVDLKGTQDESKGVDLNEKFEDNRLSEKDKLFILEETFRKKNRLKTTKTFHQFFTDQKRKSGKTEFKTIKEIEGVCTGSRGTSFVEYINKKYLQKYGMNFSQLEKLLGVGNSTFTQYLNGTLEPTRGLVMSICSFFELDVKESIKVLESAGYCLCNSVIDDYFVYRLTNNMYGTYNFVQGVNDIVVNVNTYNNAYNFKLKEDRKAGYTRIGDKRKPTIKLDKFFDSKTHAYTNGSISMCMKDGVFNFGAGLKAASDALPDYGYIRDAEDYIYI